MQGTMLQWEAIMTQSTDNALAITPKATHWVSEVSSPTLSITYLGIFSVGIACMVVSGYFLIEGLAEFSGGAAAKRMLIVGGILFQLTESICFISAAALTSHSFTWRYILFSLGIVLFGFSIAVMTLAQKTALQAGEAQAKAIDERRENLRMQIQNYDKMIESYRSNATKQSQSIFKDSRALGQDSINRAAELEAKKMQASETLFSLNQQRQHTSSDFFKRIENVFGWDAERTEFYFLVIRSLLLELCGVILMSFGANLRAYNVMVLKLQAQVKAQKNQPTQDHAQATPQASSVTTPDAATTPPKATHDANLSSKPNPIQKSIPVPAVTPTENALTYEPETLKVGMTDEDYAWSEKWPSPKLRQKEVKSNAGITANELEYLANLAWNLFEQGIIRGLSKDTLRRALKDHCRKTISHDVAVLLAQILKSRQEQCY